MLGNRGGGEWCDVVEKLRRYKEDLHFAFVEYGGANLVHLQFDEPEENDSALSHGAASAAVLLMLRQVSDILR